MWSVPARLLVEFFDNHGMLSFSGRPRWRTISGGSARYVEALLGRFEGRLRLHTPVQTVVRASDRVLVTPRGGDPEPYDQVVLATHSDQALALLGDASAREHEVLGAIPYQAHEDHPYEARATSPGHTLSVHIESRRRDVAAFDATLNLQRHELTPASAARLSARFPLASVRVLALIYGHALGLKLTGTRVHPHPSAGTR
jgi:predicted NAD/FAD-binding protein